VATATRSRIVSLVIVLGTAFGTVLAQDGLAPEASPLREIQRLLFAGDAAAAQRALDAALAAPQPPPPHVAALLRAAAEPYARRPRAFLSVAEAFPQTRAADVALAAACVAGVDPDAAGYAPPESGYDTARDEAAAAAGAPEFVAAARRLLRARGAAADRDPASLAIAERALARLERLDATAVRVRPGTLLSAPASLRESVRCALRTRTSSSAPPVYDLRFAPGGDGDEALPTAGSYVLELTAASGDRRARRTVHVSDLEVSTLAFPASLVVFATLNDEPQAGVAVRFDEDGARDGATAPATVTDARGVALLATSRNARGRVVAQFGAHRNETDVGYRYGWWTPRTDDRVAPLLAHVTTDRPLYRPGELVRGRLLAYDAVPTSVAAADRAADRAFRPTPAAGRAFDLAFHPRTPHERTVRATADEFGVAAFEIRLPDDAPLGPAPFEATLVESAPRPLGADGRRTPAPVVHAATPCVVRAFARPPLLVECAAPTTTRVGDADPLVVARATYPNGAPAAGVRGELRATAGSWTDVVPFALDADGRAAATLRVSTLRAPRLPTIAWRLELAAPDGQSVVHDGTLEILPRASTSDPPPAPDAERRAALRLALVAPAVAGSPLEIDVSGTPHARAAVVLGRDRPWAVEIARLDAQGKARVSFATTDAAWPALRVSALDLASFRDDDLDVDVGRPGTSLRVTCDFDGARFAPGADVALAFEVRDADGRPAAASITVAVVDETVFALEADRTADAATALTPDAELAWAYKALGAPRVDWDAALAGLLHDGMVAPGGRGGSGGGNTGGGARGGGSADAVRRDFRATAFFVAALRTDAAGHAVLKGKLPEDLATWRATAIAADARGATATARFAFRTTKPASVALVPPRFLRTGDALAVPALVAADDAADDAAAGRMIAFAAEGAASRATAEPPRALDAARETTLALPIRAGGRDGDATLTATLAGADGARLDAERRTLPVLPPRTVPVGSASSLVRAASRATVVTPPADDARPDDVFELHAYRGRNGLLAAAADYLYRYPFGCVEQTASALAPYCAAAFARRAAGTADPATPAQRASVAAGFARLRGFRRADGYAWWSGDAEDFAMTPVVLGLFADAGAAGFAAEAASAAPALDRGFYARAVDALAASDGDPALVGARLHATDPTLAARFDARVPASARGPLVVETVAAMLRFSPADAGAKTALVAFARRGAAAPSATLVRAARALAAAGEAELARGLAARADAAPTADGPLGADGPATIAAERLALAVDLGDADARRAPLAAAVLARFAHGRFETTRGSAAALVALARDDLAAASRPAAPRDGVLRIAADALEPRTFAFGAAAPHVVAPLPPGVRTVVVDASEADETLVVVRRMRRLDDRREAAASRPLGVERRLYSGTGAARRELLPDADGATALAVGDVVDVELTFRAPSRRSYVVATCPLPAGAEVVGDPAGADVRDDRVDFGLSVGADGTTLRRFRLRVAAEGDVAWPPAYVENSYAPEEIGWSSGGALRIAPRAAASATSAPVAFSAEAARALVDARDDARLLAAFPVDAARERLAHRILPDALQARDFDKAAVAWFAASHLREDLYDGRSLSRAMNASAAESRRFAYRPRSRDGGDDFLSELAGRGRFTERWLRGDAALGVFEAEIAVRRLLAKGGDDALPPGARLAQLVELREAPAPAALGAHVRGMRVEIYAQGVTAVFDALRGPDDAPASPDACGTIAATLEAAVAAARRAHDEAAWTDTLEWLAESASDVVNGAAEADEPFDAPSDGDRGGAVADGRRAVALALVRVGDAVTERLARELEAGGDVRLPAESAVRFGERATRVARCARLLAAARSGTALPKPDEEFRFVDRIVAPFAGLVQPGDEVFGPLLALLAADPETHGAAVDEAFSDEARAVVPTDVLLEGWRRAGSSLWAERLAARGDGRGPLKRALAAHADAWRSVAAVRALADAGDERPWSETPTSDLRAARRRGLLELQASLDVELARRASDGPPSVLARVLRAIVERPAPDPAGAPSESSSTHAVDPWPADPAARALALRRRGIALP
jgi:hypothetical protein